MGYEDGDDDAISKSIQVTSARGEKETQLGQHSIHDPKCHTIDIRQEALTACVRSWETTSKELCIKNRLHVEVIGTRQTNTNI